MSLCFVNVLYRNHLSTKYFKLTRVVERAGETKYCSWQNIGRKKTQVFVDQFLFGKSITGSASIVLSALGNRLEENSRTSRISPPPRAKNHERMPA